VLKVISVPKTTCNNAETGRLTHYQTPLHTHHHLLFSPPLSNGAFIRLLLCSAKKDLKASRVKLAARDVLLSKKIIFSLAAVPILWVSYAVLALLFSSLEVKTILVLFLCCPFFSYVGVMAMERSFVDLKDLRPAFLRLLPSFKQAAEKLPAQRAALQVELRALVEKYGPSFGPLYTDKTDAWEAAHHVQQTVRYAC
jgi:hypothetical protein